MIGYKNLVGDFGIFIDDIIYGIDDMVEYHYTDDVATHTLPIEYENDGRAYFQEYDNKYYFDEFVKIDKLSNVNKG